MYIKIKNYNLLIPCPLYKGHPNYRTGEAFSPQKRTSPSLQKY
jgi:hypothetical protein